MIPTNRYEKEPRKRRAYLRACDIVFLGGERRFWKHPDLDQKEAEEVWKNARRDVLGTPSRYVWAS